jgi:mRNA interferase RelE/StbE
VSYRLTLAATAQRQLGRLPERYALAIVEFMTGPLVDNPLVVGKELHGPLTGLRSARRGVYRVIYRIDDDQVIVLRVDHRSDVYRL